MDNTPPHVVKRPPWRPWLTALCDGALLSFSPRQPFKSKTVYAFGLVLTLVVIAVFDSLFYNRYYPLAEGWFSVYAQFMEKGFMPYRDFHLFLAPFYQLIICLFTHLFGYSMIDLRVAGVLLNIILSALVYVLCAQFFEAPIAFLCSVIAVAYYQSSVVFINYDFLHFMTTFSLAACVLICSQSNAMSALPLAEKSPIPWRLLLAGLLAGLAFLTKQSNGLIIAFCLGLAALVSGSPRGRWEAIRSGLYFTVGLVIPLAATFGWLEIHDLWGPFVEDTLKAGASSKGGLDAILFAWIPRLFTSGRIKGFWAFVVFLILMYMEGTWRTRRSQVLSLAQTKFRSAALLWIAFVLMGVSVLWPFEWMAGSQSIKKYYYLAQFDSVLTLLGALFAAAIPLGCLYVKAANRSVSLPLLIVGLTSIGFLVGNGTSAAIDMAGAFLPSGLLFGYLLAAPLPARWAKTSVVMVGAVFVFYLCSEKYVTPYLWWGLSQADVRRTAPIEGIPDLKGLQTSMADGGMAFRDVVRLVDRYSSPSDSMFTFPHMSQFHMLTGRNPETFAAVHWFDVASDAVALHDAQVLQISPPKIIVFMDVPSVIWKEHEKGFRNGQPSGQREIRQVLGRMIDQGRYSLVLKRWIPQNNILTVWVRRDKVSILRPLGEPHG